MPGLLPFRADLHVHTVLSPCADIEMIPPLIVDQAISLGINLIAITDHNASANIEAVQLAARDTMLTVLPGMEVQTREDVHVLCLFDTLDQINQLQTIVDGHLPQKMNKPDFFGHQLIVDQLGNYVATEERLLITSTTLSIDDVFKAVAAIGGVMIPAHVNRKVNGLIEILGFVPTEIPIEALEISHHLSIPQAWQQFPQIKSYPLIQNGDVHRLSEFLGATVFTIAAPTIAEMRMAFSLQSGRNFSISPIN